MSSSSIHNVMDRLNASFRSQKTKSLSFRQQQLDRLANFLITHKQQLQDALQADFKCEVEAKFEVAACLDCVLKARDNVKSWMQSTSVGSIMAFKLDSKYIEPEPFGTVLIIGAWNYPLLLTIQPLVGAIAAGNCVLLKPSELASHCSQLLADHLCSSVASVPGAMDSSIDGECYAVMQGDADFSKQLLSDARFDYIFFTGSQAVGKGVLQAASANLTPVTLELGGKSPCLVSDALSGEHMQAAANRIIWGKCFNAGQTCIAPDYVVVPAKIKDVFMEALKQALLSQQGSDPLGLKQSNKDDSSKEKNKEASNEAVDSVSQSSGSSAETLRPACLSSIVNERHFQRLKELAPIDTPMDAKRRLIQPCFVEISGDAWQDHPLMQEEIFGPILPVITVNDLWSDGVQDILLGHNHSGTSSNNNNRLSGQKPLVVYVFSDDSKEVKRISQAVSSGSLVINDTLMHFTCDTLPFGGVGASGMGKYHGKASFDTFSHAKSVMWRGFWDEPVNKAMRYPPNVVSKYDLVIQMLYRTKDSIFKALNITGKGSK